MSPRQLWRGWAKQRVVLLSKLKPLSDRPRPKGRGFRSYLMRKHCGIQKRTGRFNGDAYDLAKQDDRSYVS